MKHNVSKVSLLLKSLALLQSRFGERYGKGDSVILWHALEDCIQLAEGVRYDYAKLLRQALESTEHELSSNPDDTGQVAEGKGESKVASHGDENQLRELQTLYPTHSAPTPVEQDCVNRRRSEPPGRY